MKFSEIFEEAIKASSPTLYISSGTERDLYEKVAMALAYLKSRDSPDLEVIIDSGGGSVGSGLDIYDLIRLYQGKTTGLVISKAASMAAVVLQACDVRKCAAHAGILIHHLSTKSVSLDTMVSKRRRDKLISEMQKDQNQLYDILVAKTGKTKAQILRECKLDRYMNAHEAKSFGLVDEVV